MKGNNANNDGFTLIELLVVIAISSVALVTGFMYLGGYRSEQNLKLTARELMAAVKNTQQLSKGQQDGKKWGMRFTNSTSGDQSYTVFSGTSYAAGTVSQTYPLRRNISFSNPWASSTLDLIFNAVTGYAPNSQVISLVDGRQDGLVNDIIMNSLGQITSKFDTGLAGYWHLDEGTATTTYDASGRGNTGTLTNEPTWQSGSNCKAGSCLSFDGTDDYVSFPNGFIQTLGDFTISGWFYWADNGNWSRVFDFGTGTTVNMFLTPKTSDTNTLRFAITVGGGGAAEQRLTAPSSVTSGAWHHFAVTHSSDLGTLYIDGASVMTNSSMTLSPSSLGNTTQNWLGRSQYVADPYFSGRIDEIRIYDRALTAAEIADIYNSTR